MYRVSNEQWIDTKCDKEQSNHNICYADTEIEAVNYEPRISEVLNASPHEGLILLKITHYNELDEPILYSLNYMKNSLVQFKITRKYRCKKI